MWAADEELLKLRIAYLPRADMVAIHMNRLILHLVFQTPDVKALLHDNASELDLISAARRGVGPTFEKVAKYRSQSCR